jgi:hypothetical protein
MKTLRFDFSATDPSTAFVEPTSNTALKTPTQPPQFRNGTEKIQIEAIDSQNLGALLDLSSYTVEFAVGNKNAAAESGSVQITDTAAASNVTISYNTTAAELQTLLNAMNSNAGPNSDTVVVTGTAGLYKIRWNSTGSVDLLTVVANTNIYEPACGVTIIEETAGDGSTQEVQVINIQQSPAAFRDAWTATSTTLQGIVSFNTHQMLRLLNHQPTASTFIEIRVQDGTENVARAQIATTIHGSVIDLNTITSVSLPDVYTQAAANLFFDQNRHAITNETGGTSADLDGIITAGGAAAAGTLVTIEAATDTIGFWRLEAGTDAEDVAAGIVRPDDYASSTNEFVWKLKTLTVNKTTTELVSITGAGNTNITPAANIAIHTAFITITDTGTSGATGDFSATISLVSTNATDGDIINLRFASTLPMDETVTIYDATTGGTLLTTFPRIDAGTGTKNYAAEYAYESTTGEYKEVSAAWID